MSITESTPAWTSMVSSKYTTRQFHGPLRDPVGVHIGNRIWVEPCGMRNSSTDSGFACHTKIFHRRKSDANKWGSSKWGNFNFGVQFDHQGQSLHKTRGILTKLFCTSGPNLVITVRTDHRLSCRQASDWYTHTHGHIDTRKQRQYLEAKTGLG